MAQYLVSYELMTRGKLYDDLLGALRGFGGRRVLWSQWFVESPLDADHLCRYFAQYLHPHDRLVVVALGSDRAGRNALQPLSQSGVADAPAAASNTDS